MQREAGLPDGGRSRLSRGASIARDSQSIVSRAACEYSLSHGDSDSLTDQTFLGDELRADGEVALLCLGTVAHPAIAKDSRATRYARKTRGEQSTCAALSQRDTRCALLEELDDSLAAIEVVRVHGGGGRLVRDLNADDREGGYALTAAECSQFFIGGGLDADALRDNAEKGCKAILHRIEMREDARSFCDEGTIDIIHAPPLLTQETHCLLDDAQRADVFARLIPWGEPIANVGLSESSEDGISEGVAEDIRVAMTVEPCAGVDFYPSEDEGAWGLGKAMDIVAESC